MNTGGLEKQLLNLAYNLNQNKYSIAFTSDQESSDYKEEIISNGWEYIYLPSSRDIGILQYCLKLYEELKRNKYDIVHSHELFHSGLVMLVSFSAGVKKRIAHSHSTKDDSAHASFPKIIYHLLMRMMIRLFATDMIACSSEAGWFLFGKRKEKRIKVIWNTVNTDEFLNPNTSSVRDVKRIVHVGRFVELKNQRMIMQIAAETNRRGLLYRYTFVGNGPTFEADKGYAETLNLGDKIEFLGNRDDVPNILHESDAFILPSLFEGMPLSLIEAQAAGLHCVVSDTITEEVDFGLGLIHRLSLNDSIKKWADTIEAALRAERPDNEMIQKAIHSKGFDNKDYARKVEEVYSSI